MELNWDVANFLLRIAQLLLVPFVGFLTKQLWELRRDIIELKGRVKSNEDRLACGPDDKEFHKLALSIEALRGDVRATNEKLVGVERVVDKLDRILDRQETYLLNGGSK